ncbi:hypothetical protein CAI21_12530 [Alkalilimnicola ehrlichii]|uniref:STAS domain-containing protein n=1 Tax=Alkalilimnicola ehrlichii TaxID=351052 RepID=A0A3E0X036_9GAMM|nr:STAS domain-containing protein [Alkalilimnicola ehrlichii]RFA28390.1 hypothetical protein CAI21_12530 [Alkalilimnicola ehrlichii]RFA38545.1 hypothetical protein CAL65_04130 [Alkalilimnicola ehrlichii]
MGFELVPSEAGKFRFIGELCVFHAEQLKPRLLSMLKEGDALELDLAGVQEVDTAGLQLLLMLKREAAERDVSLTLVNHSEELLNVIGLLNLSQAFGDPLVLPAEPVSEVPHGSR